MGAGGLRVVSCRENPSGSKEAGRGQGATGSVTVGQAHLLFFLFP